MRNTQTAAMLLYSLLMVAVVSCSQKEKDKEIKADLTTKAKSEKDLLGVRFTIENGIVTLTGEYPTDKAKAHVESIVKGLYGVKSIKSNIAIAPVVLGTDQLLKESADSVLKKYAGVNAIVKDSMIVLQGKVENKEASQLLTALQN